MPLVDSEKWKAAFVGLNSLRFHPANPRLPGMAQKSSEREIIEALCERGQVEVIARSIADKGYLRNERLIVYKESNRSIVYEGNRRLCALKVLANPDLAPSSKRKLFRRLADRAKLPKKIAVDVVPTRFDAEVVMFTKHAGAQYMVKWEPVQKAAFVVARLEEGESIDEIVRNHGISKPEVIKSQALLGLYRMCRLAPLSKAASRLIDDPDLFPTSIVFERLVEPKKAGALLGFEITDKGLLAPEDPAFLSILAKILDDVVAGEIDTRKLNSESEQIAYVNRLKYKPSASKKVDVEEMEREQNKAKSGEQSPIDSKTKSTSTPPINKSSKPPAQRSAPRSNRLFPRDLICEISHSKLLSLVDEGKELVIDDSPNACAVFLRCVFDIALQVAMDQRKCVQQVVNKYQKKSRDSINTPMLLEEIRPGNLVDLKLDGMEVRTIDTLKAKGLISYDMLHLVIHNISFSATTESVTQLRDIVVPILQKALLKP